MNRHSSRIVFTLVLLWPPPLFAVERSTDSAEPLWKAGIASAKITPDRPLPMSGYASRKEFSEGTEQDLFAKALAIEDLAGTRAVMVTLDLIGVREELRSAVTSEVQRRYQLSPEAVLLNASHTHCGPDYSHADSAEYFAWLKLTLADLIGAAIEKLEPATLAFSSARAGFAMNRRTPTESGFQNHPNPEGPVDQSVPVLSVRNSGGELRGVVFGYACHNTTMGFRRWLGDYAGYAQEYLEQDHPGVTALFMMGCGADQNPYPRRELKYAQRHGRALATAVEAALELDQTRPRHQTTLTGPLRIDFDTVDLSFTTDDRPDFPYPVQILRFGDDLMLVALASEVVVDYSLRLKFELTRPAGPTIWVAGYSNVYSGYIPSRRVLLEGGYEAQSRPWDPTLEERIVGKVHELVEREAIKVSER